MDISEVNRQVIYRTRSAGSIYWQYIGSTRKTQILIILVFVAVLHLHLKTSIALYRVIQETVFYDFALTDLKKHLIGITQ